MIYDPTPDLSPPKSHSGVYSPPPRIMMLAATTTSITLRRQLLLLSSSRSIPTAAAAAAAVTNNQYRRSIHIEKKLTTLGIELPPAPMPKANYNIMCIPPGENVMYLSGHLPIKVSAAFEKYYIYITCCLLCLLEKLSIF